MKWICELYIKRAGVLGFLYCAIPVTLWFVHLLVTSPFRQVYLLRLGLCVVVGGAIGAHINRFGIEMWLAKHRGPTGPASVWEGTLTGTAIGLGMAFLPALTALIGTNHPEQAKTFVIVATAAAGGLGGLVGTIVSAAGRKHLDGPPTKGDG